MNSDIYRHIKILWNYHVLGQKPENVDIIIGQGSQDLRTAERCAELYFQWFASKILFSWWLWKITWNESSFNATTEAERFAFRAQELWVPKEDILIENKSSNTGENILFSYEILKDLHVNSMIVINKPYMERRVYATFQKQRPNQDVICYVSSPQLSLDEYFDGSIDENRIINLMVWDLQRIIEYPKLWFQIPQEVPEEVLKSYEYLKSAWYVQFLMS